MRSENNSCSESESEGRAQQSHTAASASSATHVVVLVDEASVDVPVEKLAVGGQVVEELRVGGQTHNLRKVVVTIMQREG